MKGLLGNSKYCIGIQKSCHSQEQTATEKSLQSTGKKDQQHKLFFRNKKLEYTYFLQYHCLKLLHIHSMK